MLTADEDVPMEALLIVENHLSLRIRAKVREVDPAQDFKRMDGDHERQRHQLRRFIGDVTIDDTIAVL